MQTKEETTRKESKIIAPNLTYDGRVGTANLMPWLSTVRRPRASAKCLAWKHCRLFPEALTTSAPSQLPPYDYYSVGFDWLEVVGATESKSDRVVVAIDATLLIRGELQLLLPHSGHFVQPHLCVASHVPPSSRHCSMIRVRVPDADIRPID